MQIFESLFDITYLILVISLGVRLLLEKKAEAKLFGIMAILLGLGDSFHLIPRVISHLSPGGFEAHGAGLSWGQFVTSITMTIFYILYYYYYKKQSGDKDRKKTIAIYVLAIARIALVLMPQNQWGQMPGNYMFGIYRNIPFAIMGALLIYWSYKERIKPGLKHMDLLIFLSFLFYIPVVLFSESFPMVGALMMPKTVAYFLIVVFGFKLFVGEFKLKGIFALSITFLIMGLVGGVFYREFTKYYAFTANNHLSKIHVHTIVLGFIGLFMLYSFMKGLDAPALIKIKKPLRIYISGLTFTIVNMVLLGIYEVVSEGQAIINRAAVDGISGIGHILLGVGIVWTFIKLYSLDETK